MTGQLVNNKNFDELVKIVEEGKAKTISITGTVGVGKSTFAQNLKDKLLAQKIYQNIVIISTDNFLFDNKTLEEKGIINKKGYPESYDWKKLSEVLIKIHNSQPFETPVYSHELYDITDQKNTYSDYDLVIFEGINCLESFENYNVYSKIDLNLFLITKSKYNYTWFKYRLQEAVQEGVQDPKSFYYQFHKHPKLTQIWLPVFAWNFINQPNNKNYILPSKTHADYVVEFNFEHQIINLKKNFH